MPYLVPNRDDFDIHRADISLGMRRAARYYNELVVPGIGGAWRVRHLSSSVAGIYLKQQIQGKYSAIAITHGIEALGNKLEWSGTEVSNRKELRIRGIRAFTRNEDSWAFSELSQKRFYVQITHRQQCTRALAADTGLGFTQGSGRFNAMALTPVGEELAKFLIDRKGVVGSKLEANLKAWVANAFDPALYLDKLNDLLSPLSPTVQERELVYGRLKSLVPASTEVGLRDPHRRDRLISFLEREVRKQQDWFDTKSLLSWLETTPGGSLHAKDIRTAIAFEEMRIAGVNLLGRLAELLGSATARLPLRDCVANSSVKLDIQKFRNDAKKYLISTEQGKNSRPDAIAFAHEASLDDLGVIRSLVKRDGRILSLADDVIYPGPVYRSDFHGTDADQDPDQETNFEGRPSRLLQFIALWRDCRG